MRKFGLAISIPIVLMLSWYLFIKPSEYEVNFKVKTWPGDIIQTVKIWSKTIDYSQGLEVLSMTELKQQIVQNGRIYYYHWNIEMLDDSTSSINIEISEEGKSLLNKVLIPFTNQAIEDDAKELIYELYDIIKEHLEITKVQIVGETETKTSFCICALMESDQTEKAFGMMKYYHPLATFIDNHGLTVSGPPMVNVMDWDHNSGRLKYDFCFPIVEEDDLPQYEPFVYKLVKGQKTVKAIYNGNYITSDRAWYALIQYAKSNEIDITELPLEIFYNNPNLGAGESEWKAEIYMPVK